MKKGLGTTVLTVILLFVFAISGILAAWEANGDTTNKITIASVKGSIEEIYKQDPTVYPNGTIDKVVNVRNTGTIDCLVRVKVDKVWGSDRTDDNTLIPDSSLSTDNIQIAFNSVDWIYFPDDGYFYYKHVLPPGELTNAALFESFTITPSTDNLYEGKKADIRIYLECVQAAGNGISIWDRTFEELDIVYNPDKPVYADTSVTFISPTDGFEFNPEDGDLFHNFKNLIPGESVTQGFVVGNEYYDTTEIYFYARITDQPHATEETKELIDKLLKEYAIVSIRDEDGKVLYRGPIDGNLSENSMGVSLKEPILLNKFKKSEYKRYTISLYLDPQMDNKFIDLLGLIDWVFFARGIASDEGEPPKMGDNFQLMGYIAVMIISAALIIVLNVRRNKPKNAKAR